MWFNQWYQRWIFYQFFLNLYFDKINQPGQHLQATFHVFFQIKFTFWHKIQKIDFNFVFLQVKSNKVICILHLCFDRKNPTNWFEFLLWHENSNKLIWICVCVLTKETNLINIYRLNIKFFQMKFTFWQDKSRKLSWVLCFDR